LGSYSPLCPKHLIEFYPRITSTTNYKKFDFSSTNQVKKRKEDERENNIEDTKDREEKIVYIPSLRNAEQLFTKNLFHAISVILDKNFSYVLVYYMYMYTNKDVKRDTFLNIAEENAVGIKGGG
jgi:hypothetical protein